MNRFKSYSWENRPKNLDADEIRSPFSVLDHYYDEWSFDYENDLEEWEYSVIAYDCFKEGALGSGEDLLYMYKAVLKISEALFVINDLIEIGHTFPMYTEEQVNLEKRKSLWFPKNLNKRERMDPYKTIKTVFKNIELQRLRDYLWEFLVYGLSARPCDDMFDFEQVNLVFKQIHKLVSIAYLLINRNELDWKETKC